MVNTSSRTNRRILPALAVCTIAVAAACEHKQELSATAKTTAADSLPTVAIEACPSDGRWNPCVLVDRLVHAGAGAKEVETDTTRVPFLAPPGIHYRIGKNGLLIAFYFADSVAAKKSWRDLDTLRLMPKGDTTTVWPSLVSPIRSGNLVAAFMGTSNAQVERVSLALRAGLPAPR